MDPSPCLDENTVLAFFASPRDAEVAARVDAHVADCDACRAFVAAYAVVRTDASAGGPSPETGPSLPGTSSECGPHRALAYAQAARRVGQVLAGKWTVERLVGVGGMAQVFAAQHENGRRVAIKMMRPELAVEPILVRRFLREAYAANRVDHPGAVAIHDDDKTEDGVPFLVMDLLEGRTLRDRITEGGPLPAAEAVRIVSDVLAVLAAAHDKGIVHRDVKPENVFETRQGEVRVLDFGIARLLDSNEGVTQSGMTLGTVGYMPPEQARGQASLVDARSDVWAVGATLHYLLTASPVHEAATHNEELLLAMTRPAPPVRSRWAAVPEGVARVLDRALAFEREKRWADARKMRAALAVADTSPPIVRARSRGGRWAAGIVALAAGAGALAVVAHVRAPHTPPLESPPPDRAAAASPEAPVDSSLPVIAASALPEAPATASAHPAPARAAGRVPPHAAPRATEPAPAAPVAPVASPSASAAPPRVDPLRSRL